MFNFFSQKSVSSILSQFTKLKDQLEAAMVHHTNEKIRKTAEINDHDAEYKAAMKAYKAVETFI